MLEHKFIFPSLSVLTIIVYVIGMCYIPMMEIDAAQYAAIAEELVREKQILQIQYMGENYLDKPPLLFWLSALSMSLFGYSSFSYKFISVLGILLGIYSTYRFSRLYYSLEVSKYAALILASCQAFFIMANDCRTDNLLIGCCCFAIWKVSSYIQGGRQLDLYTGFIGIGLAMLAKGPLGLMFPLFTLGSILITKQNFRCLHGGWLWSIPIVGIILAPMCIGLYLQYGWRGLEFYFWTQSFGRITGQSTWANNTGPFYFTHTFLWSFLPFSFLFLPALYQSIKNFAFRRHALTEYGTMGGFVLTFIALSWSQYKLPHYIYIVSPFASILAAKYMLAQEHGIGRYKWYTIAQYALLLLLIALSIALAYVISHSLHPLIFVSILLLVVSYRYILKHAEYKKQIILMSILTSIIANLILNSLFYPNLLKYQSSSEVAFYIIAQNIPKHQVQAFKKYSNALSYYLHEGIPYETDLTQAMSNKDRPYVYTNEAGIIELENSGISFATLKKFDDFPVSRLNYLFLNPATRKTALSSAFLIKLSLLSDKDIKKGSLLGYPF